MAINQVLAEVLAETVNALSNLDLDKLQALEQRIVILAESDERFEGDDVGLVLSKRRLLEIILQNCQVSLDALMRLHARNMRDQ
jgi:hypothetical protein